MHPDRLVPLTMAPGRHKGPFVGSGVQITGHMVRSFEQENAFLLRPGLKELSLLAPHLPEMNP